MALLLHAKWRLNLRDAHSDIPHLCTHRMKQKGQHIYLNACPFLSLVFPTLPTVNIVVVSCKYVTLCRVRMKWLC